MAYLDTKEKRKGFVGTVALHLLILVLFAIYGLKYPDPLPVTGVPINFGTSNVGSGEIQPDESGEPVPQQADPVPVDASEESVMTQEDIETVSTPPVEESDNKKTEIPKEKPVEKPKEVETVKDPTPKPQELDPDLKKVLNNNPFAKKGGSEGDDNNKSGDKGQTDGTKTGTDYSGKNGGGGGGTGSYQLGNRNALAKVKPEYKCDEYGVVVMQVMVNRQGITTDAKLKLKGTTNTANCLVSKAREAALKTKWQSDPSAPTTQVGTITYHFELN
ncbi:MAG: energy transducer TonB [Crocinitomicaceae bacterium]|nr:energy transducer TonB [Crocinitomicaceae bacterium]|tara:strand:+ start:2495 stop:3316 length:822 start_codon:yes stop_codon:yes gene_type:complete